MLRAIVRIEGPTSSSTWTALETKKPAEGIQAEISFIDGRLRSSSEIQKARKEAQRQKIAPVDVTQGPGPARPAGHALVAAGEGPGRRGLYERAQAERERLTGSAKVAHTFKDDIKANSPHQYNAEAAMISTLTGLVYPLRLIIAEAPDKRKRFRQGIAYAVIDATSPETQDKYHGYSPKADSAGHRKAIQDALDDFGDDATYGEGLIVVRIPPPSPGKQGNADAGSEHTPNPVADAHPGPKFTDHESSPGPLQRVLWALAIIAFAAGAFALSLTGAGAPVAVALLAFIAAARGAVVAAHNITKRSSRHKLESDAELALDIVSIISVVPAAIGVKFALQASALRRTNVDKFPPGCDASSARNACCASTAGRKWARTLYLVNGSSRTTSSKHRVAGPADEPLPRAKAQASTAGVRRRDRVGSDDGWRCRGCPSRRDGRTGPSFVMTCGCSSRPICWSSRGCPGATRRCRIAICSTPRAN